MQLTDNFTLEEMYQSASAKRLGLDNKPNDDEINNLKELCINVLQPLREAYGKPIIITSGYRSSRLNRAIGGAKNSEHIKGYAADIKASSKEETKKLFNLIKTLNLNFNQLINEYNYSWIHISYNKNHNRNMVLEAKKIKGRTVYQVLN